MAQIIYALAALVTVIILAFNLRVGAIAGEQKAYVNELATQMTGVASEIHGDISRRGIAFDAATNEYVLSLLGPLEFPLVTGTGQLTPEGSFGGCVDFATCLGTNESDLDDFHLMNFTVNADGLLYDVDVVVRYVNENAPTTRSGTQTWAKEIEVAVQHPAMQLGGAPMTVRIPRVYVYDRIIS